MTNFERLLLKLIIMIVRSYIHSGKLNASYVGDLIEISEEIDRIEGRENEQ